MLNAASAAAPGWVELTADVAPVEHCTVTGQEARLAAIARDAISLLAGPRRAQLRACQGPGCIQFFVKDHPRREWCSAGCGNRARAARHYRRVRDGAGEGEG